jgi:hypothetical protein
LTLTPSNEHMLEFPYSSLAAELLPDLSFCSILLLLSFRVNFDANANEWPLLTADDPGGWKAVSGSRSG